MKKPLTRQIINLLSKNEKAIKANDIARRLDAPVERVRQTLYYLHVNDRVVRAKTGYYTAKLVTPEQPTHAAMNDLHRENLMLNDRVNKLKDEVEKYHNWCLDWRAQVEKANVDKKECEKKYDHSLAVISYLEERLMNLIKHVNNNE